MRLTCPACHAEFDLAAALEDGAGREFVRWLAGLDPALPRPLVSYLALFRSRSRALAWERALRLGQEAVGLCVDAPQLARALSCTVESLRRKQGPDWKPLSNHRYLAGVLGSLEPLPAGVGMSSGADDAMQSVTRMEIALMLIDRFAGPEDLPDGVVESVKGLVKRLVVLRLEGHPPAAVITDVMWEWTRNLHRRLVGLDEQQQIAALRSAGDRLAAQARRWPTLNEVYQYLPRLPAAAAAPPEPTTEEVLAWHARMQAGAAADLPVRARPSGLKSMKDTLRSLGLPILRGEP